MNHQLRRLCKSMQMLDLGILRKIQLRLAFLKSICLWCSSRMGQLQLAKNNKLKSITLSPYSKSFPFKFEYALDLSIKFSWLSYLNWHQVRRDSQ